MLADVIKAGGDQSLIEATLKQLLSHHTKLEELNLSDNNLCNSGINAGFFNILLDQIQRSQSLKHLNLANNALRRINPTKLRWGDLGLAWWTNFGLACAKSPCLVTLNLENNNLQSKKQYNQFQIGISTRTSANQICITGFDHIAISQKIIEKAIETIEHSMYKPYFPFEQLKFLNPTLDETKHKKPTDAEWAARADAAVKEIIDIANITPFTAAEVQGIMRRFAHATILWSQNGHSEIANYIQPCEEAFRHRFPQFCHGAEIIDMSTTPVVFHAQAPTSTLQPSSLPQSQQQPVTFHPQAPTPAARTIINTEARIEDPSKPSKPSKPIDGYIRWCTVS